MKNKIIFLITFFCFTLFYSQMEVRKSDGTVITDGSVFSYNTANTEESILHFVVYNTSSSSSIKVKALCESITNSDGSEFEFCFAGNCLPFVTVGQNYPANGFSIAAGSNSGDGDHFWNQKTTSTTGNYPMTFVFKFYQVDAFGAQIGSPVSITYKSLSQLAVNETDFAKYGMKLKSTLIQNTIDIQATKEGKIYLFDASGKLVLSQKINQGDNSVNAQNLKSGMYILNSENVEGKTMNIKILKQ